MLSVRMIYDYVSNILSYSESHCFEFVFFVSDKIGIKFPGTPLTDGKTCVQIDVDDAVRHDLFYCRNLSCIIDVKTICRLNSVIYPFCVKSDVPYASGFYRSDLCPCRKSFRRIPSLKRRQRLFRCIQIYIVTFNRISSRVCRVVFPAVQNICYFKWQRRLYRSDLNIFRYTRKICVFPFNLISGDLYRLPH